MKKGEKIGIGAVVGGVLAAFGVVGASSNNGFIGSLDWANSTALNTEFVDTHSPILSIIAVPQIDPISRGTEQTIVVRVLDESSSPVVGASISAIVTYASGSHKSFSGQSDASGSWQFTWQIGGNSDTGIFNIEVNAKSTSENRTASGTGYASFEVTQAY